MAKAGLLPMSNYPKRLVSRLKRELEQVGISPRFQRFEFHQPNQISSDLSILIVAAGSVKIPTQGWGAVETIIAETIPVYLANGVSVGLLNSQNFVEWKKASRNRYDVIVCHSDSHLEKVRKHWPATPLVAITHYGLAAQPNIWHPSYKKVFTSISKADKIVCLSPAILETFSGLLPSRQLAQFGNGSEFESKPCVDKSDVIVMVGKVEERKRQYELWQYALNNKINIHFIGPIEDSRVLEHLKRDRDLGRYFKGPKNRNELATELPQYKALALLSDGEADALVLYEAQCAGLEIITNEASLGNQESGLPWIHIAGNFEDLKEVISKITSNPFDPDKISAYADSNYRWNIRLIPMINLVRELTLNEKG
jgi:glycosyltransferase involved in cell wall biosynthesis